MRDPGPAHHAGHRVRTATPAARTRATAQAGTTTPTNPRTRAGQAGEAGAGTTTRAAARAGTSAGRVVNSSVVADRRTDSRSPVSHPRELAGQRGLPQALVRRVEHRLVRVSELGRPDDPRIVRRPGGESGRAMVGSCR